MTIQDDIEVVDQATVHKLAFVQALLKQKELAFTGTREKVRARCIIYLNRGELLIEELKLLLESLDLWGNQRIRLIRIPDPILLTLTDCASIEATVQKAGFESIYQKDMPVVIGGELLPISIRYEDDGNHRFLTLIAGKIQEDLSPIIGLPDIPYTTVAALLQQIDIPDSNIIYKPYRLEHSKIISFAQIDLDSGHGILSVKSSLSAGNHKTKYEEFHNTFAALFDLGSANRVYLTKATSNIDSKTHSYKVVLNKHSFRDNDGSRVKMEGATPKSDVRQNTRQSATRSLYAGVNTGEYCDCYWQHDSDLDEDVHTSIYGSQGEIVFRGQASEESIRNVLQRIRDINN